MKRREQRGPATRARGRGGSILYTWAKAQEPVEVAGRLTAERAEGRARWIGSSV